METHDPGAHYIITKDTSYYKSGPQQGRPADGIFQEGTRVIIVEIISGYVKVETEDKTITGFVAGEDIGPLE